MGQRVRSQTRITGEGWAALSLSAALTLVGVLGGNNLVVLVGCFGWSLFALDGLLGAWNLRGLTVRRGLPDELFAQTDARGRLHVRSARRWGRSLAVEASESGASGVLEAIDPGEEAAVPVRWRFEERGLAHLEALQLRSTFPFGLVEHRRVLTVPAVVRVWPRPLPGRASPVGQSTREGGRDALRGGQGDFSGLRDYRPGDRPASIHRLSSARVGRPLVVERGLEVDAAVCVQVRSCEGRAWELELSRATGAVLEASHRGRQVGLSLPDGPGPLAEPRTGTRWRRALLDALADCPERG